MTLTKMQDEMWGTEHNLHNYIDNQGLKIAPARSTSIGQVHI